MKKKTVRSSAYDGFGILLDSTGPLVAFFRHRFCAKYFDPDTGLCYYGCRWYSPAIGPRAVRRGRGRG